MARNILVIGATSGIAKGIIHAFAKQGENLFLAGRDEIELNKISQDIKIRFNTKVETFKFDIEQDKSLPKIDDLDGVVFAVGYDGSEIDKILNINFIQAVHILNKYADYFAERKRGFIIGISSVAGDRGRQSNYIYGAAKAGFSTYLSGLRNKLAKNNVKVITIKPGFIDTVLTFGKPGIFLVADPMVIGQKIARAADKKADILYLPWFWKYIMLIIKSIPEFVFKKLSL